jgi:hypothetical protein
MLTLMAEIKHEDSNRSRPFSCPACGTPVPFSAVFFLSNNSDYTCTNCRTVLVPEKMSPLYFVVAFVATAGTGNVLMRKFDSLLPILLGSALAGLVVYLIGIIYTYKTVSFKIKL